METRSRCSQHKRAKCVDIVVALQFRAVFCLMSRLVSSLKHFTLIIQKHKNQKDAPILSDFLFREASVCYSCQRMLSAFCFRIRRPTVISTLVILLNCRVKQCHSILLCKYFIKHECDVWTVLRESTLYLFRSVVHATHCSARRKDDSDDPIMRMNC